MRHNPSLGIVICFSVVLVWVASVAQARQPDAWTRENLEDLVTLYQHLHAHPELSFQERETAALLAREWATAGAEIETGIGGEGVVGLLRNGEGPTLMLRTDLDALLVTEKTGLDYASKIKARGESGAEVGVMHACGHDVHMTNLVGVARYLSQHRHRWRGTVMLVGQPAEERGAGAKAMLEDGLFARFAKPDYALALHVDPSLGTGRIAYRAGYAMANVDSVDIDVHGHGCQTFRDLPSTSSGIGSATRDAQHRKVL